MRFDSDPADSYYQPIRTVQYQDKVADSVNWGNFGTGLDTGHQVQEDASDVQYFSDPYVDNFGKVGGERGSVSRVGPSVSVQPYAALTPGIPAGSLFSGRAYGRSPAYRGAVPYQRSFSVALQEKLRRRKRGGLFL